MTSARYLQRAQAPWATLPDPHHRSRPGAARDPVALELDAMWSSWSTRSSAPSSSMPGKWRAMVTMNSRALLHLDDEKVEVALVYPQDADDSAGKLSVCSDIGTAILGYKEGDAFDWRIPNRTRRISIEKVLYQPEAAGDFDL
jgi:hypothetical protein